MMVAGPFDRRKQQSRCLACQKSHLKCLGGQICSNCGKRGITCIRATNPAFAIDVACGLHRTVRRQHLVTLVNDDTRYTSAFFETFLSRNRFTGTSLCSDVQAHLHLSPSLQYTVLALGAYVDNCPKPRHLLLYTKAITLLNGELASISSESWLSISWCTFFLGIFELVYDSTGEGWIKHLYHGTFQILESKGPASFRSGLSRKFFLEVRLFEVVRAILLSRRTILAAPQWIELTDHVLTGKHSEDWSPREALLSIATLCSDLGIRVAEFIDTVQSPFDTPHGGELVSFQLLVQEGWQLRQSLLQWEHVASGWSNRATEDQDMVIAWMFYAATSIYLSGVFEHSPIRVAEQLPMPILPQTVIEKHVAMILERTEFASKHTNHSGLLFLFPLRVAGARAKTYTDRSRIVQLLSLVKRTFHASAAFIADLEEHWER